MTFERVHYLPILISVWFPITFVVTYTIAVCSNHVSPLFPFISDTGTFSPESCIFGQMLNLGALMMAACCYFRYLQLEDLHGSHNSLHFISKHNRISLILGLLASIGISIVANFQETNVLAMHLTGAMFAFGIGWMYCSIQTYIAFKIHPIMGTKWMNWCRVFLSTGIIVFLILVFVFAGALHNSGGATGIVANLEPGDPGWDWHFLSTLSEWILALCEIIFLGTYAHEFKRISFTGASISNKLK